MDHWHIVLVGYREMQSGDVITKDGEYLEVWASDENDFARFTPDGADEPIIADAFLGNFCQRIREWHEKCG